MAKIVRSLLFAALAFRLLTLAASADTHPDWTAPLPPFRIAEGLYYVGSRDLAAYLITTPAGHILINANLVSYSWAPTACTSTCSASALMDGEGAAVFIDPAGYLALIDEAELAFDQAARDRIGQASATGR